MYKKCELNNDAQSTLGLKTFTMLLKMRNQTSRKQEGHIPGPSVKLHCNFLVVSDNEGGKNVRYQHGMHKQSNYIK